MARPATQACAYCDATFAPGVGYLLDERANLLARPIWQLWLCPDCRDLVQPIYAPDSNALPDAIRGRLKR